MRSHLAAVAVLAVGALGALGAAGPLSGCASTGDAQQVTGRSRLVSDLATRLAHSGTLTYTATYRMPGGTRATLAQAQVPARAAYTYAGGKLVLTSAATADCRVQGVAATCTLAPPPSPGADPAAALISEIDNLRVMAPSMVIGLLTAAALDADASISQHDTTIVGQNATCANVQGLVNAAATEFTACITSDGLLGSFTGKINGSQVDISLDRYETTVAADTFDLPAGAKVVDKR
jgi:hypothetical protein